MEGSAVEMELDEVDKSKFLVRLHRFALRIPKQQSHVVARILSGYVLDMPRVRHIVPDPADENMRIVILSDLITDLDLQGLPEEQQRALKDVVQVDVVAHVVNLDYSYWPVEHILKEILPTGWEVPSSFETIGHIAHLNLRDDLLPYRKIIASVILDKNPKLRTILNKVGTITNEFRVPEFEVLAGDPNLVTEVKQHGATFRLDYGSVYWNSRLEGEHKRLFSQFKDGQIVCDMFAGIGPFVIPAARKGCVVYANDLNPASVKYLKINSEVNKVGERVRPYNMDARAFMQHIVIDGVQEPTAEEIARDEESLKRLQGSSNSHVGPESAERNPEVLMGPTLATNGSGIHMKCGVREKEHGNLEASKIDGRDMLKTATLAQDTWKNSQRKSPAGKDRSKLRAGAIGQARLEAKPWEHFDHVVMNLPASALEFLDVFEGLLSREKWKGTMPRVHCYCFMRSNETTADVVQRAEHHLKGSIGGPQVWTVRDVAPNKIMLCLSFDLPSSVAFAQQLAPAEQVLEDGYSEALASLKRPRTD